MCPKGDDPLTLNQNYRTFQLDTYSTTTTATGNLIVTFQGGRIYLPMSSPSSSGCKSAFESSGYFDSVECTYTSVTSYHRKYQIEVLQWPVSPQQNNIWTHSGNPDISNFGCDTSLVESASITCKFSDVYNTNVRGMINPLSLLCCI